MEPTTLYKLTEIKKVTFYSEVPVRKIKMFVLKCPSVITCTMFTSHTVYTSTQVISASVLKKKDNGYTGVTFFSTRNLEPDDEPNYNTTTTACSKSMIIRNI